MKELSKKTYYCMNCGSKLEYSRDGVIYFCHECKEEIIHKPSKEPILHRIIRKIIEQAY